MLSRTTALNQIYETLSTYLKLALRKSVMGPIVPPEGVRGMKVLDKKAFDTVIRVPYVEIPQSELGYITRALKPYMLKMRGLPPVQATPNSTDKIILLNPEMVTSVADFEPVVQTKLKLIGCVATDMKEKGIAVGYDHFKAPALLRAILPENLPITAGFSTVGHVLHLNLREHHFEYKSVIGQILLDKNVNVRTVINKVNTIDNTYRNFQMELLAGENDMVVTVKEHGCTFEFDYSTVYWNSRLSSEHTRIAEKFQGGHILFDVFGGVGPFAIPVGKKKCQVYANDLNPESYKWLCHNVKMNKVEKFVETYNLDGRDFIKNVVGVKMQELEDKKEEVTIQIVMNLPAIGIEFLDTFQGLCLNQSLNFVTVLVHSYCFIKDESNLNEAQTLVEANLGMALDPEHIDEILLVRSVSPNKNMVRVSFRLPKAVVLEKIGSEPPLKKIKV